jgi:hypothetical protein
MSSFFFLSSASTSAINSLSCNFLSTKTSLFLANSVIEPNPSKSSLSSSANSSSDFWVTFYFVDNLVSDFDWTRLWIGAGDFSFFLSSLVLTPAKALIGSAASLSIPSSPSSCTGSIVIKEVT